MPNGFLPSLSYLYKLRANVMTAFTGYFVCACTLCMCVCVLFILCMYIRATRYNHYISYNECLSFSDRFVQMRCWYIWNKYLCISNMIWKLKGNDFIITLWIFYFMRIYINTDCMKYIQNHLYYHARSYVSWLLKLNNNSASKYIC